MSYEQLAAEYYDRKAHPTCFNFRTASASILGMWKGVLIEAKAACEVGCGMSLYAELLRREGRDVGQLELVDSSPSMLAYSAVWLRHGAKLTVADAADLPFTDGSFDVVVSSLGDSYNTGAFWRESRRVLRHGGTLAFTTPSFEWATAFRSRGEGEVPDKALFVSRDGTRCYVPSIILGPAEQVDLMAAHGFSLREMTCVRRREIADEQSPKLGLAGGAGLEVVTGYLVRKER